MPVLNFSQFSFSQIHFPHFVVLGNILSIIFTILCIFFLFLISYAAVRIFEIREKEHHHLKHEIYEYAHHHSEEAKKSKEAGRSKNGRWNQVIDHIFSPSPADWKVAIIEADSMLDAMLHQMDFKGETLGDRLKQATRETFPHLSDAWEAHAVRNRIAHEGSQFELSGKEAKRIVALYEGIFRDFGYI
jgi:hypothetical protein